jgi:hypothetical protein
VSTSQQACEPIIHKSYLNIQFNSKANIQVVPFLCYAKYLNLSMGDNGTWKNYLQCHRNCYQYKFFPTVSGGIELRNWSPPAVVAQWCIQSSQILVTYSTKVSNAPSAAKFDSPEKKLSCWCVRAQAIFYGFSWHFQVYIYLIIQMLLQPATQTESNK